MLSGAVAVFLVFKRKSSPRNTFSNVPSEEEEQHYNVHKWFLCSRNIEDKKDINKKKNKRDCYSIKSEKGSLHCLESAIWMSDLNVTIRQVELNLVVVEAVDLRLEITYICLVGEGDLVDLFLFVEVKDCLIA